MTALPVPLPAARRSAAAGAISPLLLSVLLFALLPALSAHGAGEPSVTGVRGTARGREARLSFQVRNAFPPEMLEALKTGMEISFRYEARVERVRHGWFNSDLAQASGNRTVRYDSLARVFRLQRGGKEELLPDVRSAVDAMTRYDLVLPLDDDVAPGDLVRGYGRVRLDRVGLSDTLRTVLFFTQLWDVQTPWSRGYLSTQ